jgi:tetratricopeptide (TPR) repeat protein
MSPMKRAVPAVLLAVLALVEILLSWSAHLQERAMGFADDPVRRIRILERASALFPWNAGVHFELGKAYFDVALRDLDDPGRRDSFLVRSTRRFLRALRIDPGSAAGHFHLGQSLLYMTYLGMETPASAYEEYKKAALLTGHNTQIYFEVGKVLLARWDSLPDAEKSAFKEILARLMEGRDPSKFRALLEIWSLHSGDTALVESIMPADAGMLRTYAAFLGERSLAIGRRKEALARAESLDFQKAGSEFELGRRSYDYFQTERARGHLAECLRLLEGIRFYGGDAGRSLVDGDKYAGIMRDTHLLLAKIEIDQSRDLADPNSHMRAYLALEKRVSGAADFESFLRERALLGERGAAASDRTSFSSLSLEMTLDFLQNRYRDITRLGEELESHLLVVPDAARQDYIEILRLIGVAHFRLDYVYEAERLFLKALDLDSGNLGVLLGLERCYERRNDRAKAGAVRKAISALLTPGELPLGSQVLAKGEARMIEIISDGRSSDLVLDLEAAGPRLRPLVSVEFEDQIVFEDFVEGESLTFDITPKVGKNWIRVRPVNAPIRLVRLLSAPGRGNATN